MAAGSTTLERDRPAARRVSGDALGGRPLGGPARPGERHRACPSATPPSAASGTTSRSPSAPIALPDPWVVSNYTDVLTDPGFWQQLGNSLLIAVITTVVVVAFAALAAFVFARRAFRGREVMFTLFTLGPAVPGRRRDPAAVRPGPDARAAGQPAGHRPAPGGVRAAAHDHHPAPVLPEHPQGARGRRGDRRLRHVRVLLADPPAAVQAGPGHGRRAGHRVQLERLPAAAGHPVRPGELDAAAGRDQLLDPVLVGHGADPGLHDAVAASRPSSSTSSPSASSSAA